MGSPTLPPSIPPPPPPVPSRGRTGVIIAIVVVFALMVAGSIFAVTRGGGTAASGPSAVTTPSASSSIVPPPTPTGLHAHPSSFTVTLTWSAGEGPGPTTGFTIYRDGATVGLVKAGHLRFVDHKAVPESTYHYQVAAYGGEFGTESRGRASVTTRTKKGPLALARLVGTFNVRLHLTSSYGFSGLGNSTRGWRFAPTCSSGACNVRMIDIHRSMPPTELDRTVASYDGLGVGKLTYTCGGVTRTDTGYHVHVRIAAAGDVHGTWGATKVEGTYTITQPAGFGCRSGGASYTLTGTLVGH